MEQTFITKIHINKVRHLENISIPLSEKERKHLILTGKNGSGKTSVLEAMKTSLNYLIKENRPYELLLEQLTENEKHLTRYESQLKEPNANVFEIQNQIKSGKDAKTYLSKIIADNFNAITSFPNIHQFFQAIKENSFFVSYFPAKRKTGFNKPLGIKKVNFPTNVTVDTKLNQEFVQHLVNLKADKLFALDEGEKTEAVNIDKWFDKLTNFLRNLFNKNELTLSFNRKEYNFWIEESPEKRFDFHTLSDGFSSVIEIISEILMQMERMKMSFHDTQGIVLIDEIETHLHIDLQKKIMPFLTTFFPNIQFIVTTHSPFVLTSVDNAVIFDLENQIRVEDLSLYSIEGVVEGYFHQEMYAQKATEKFERYKFLSENSQITEAEKAEMFDLRQQLRKVPDTLAPELVLAFQLFELKRLEKVKA